MSRLVHIDIQLQQNIFLQFKKYKFTMNLIKSFNFVPGEPALIRNSKQLMPVISNSHSNVIDQYEHHTTVPFCNNTYAAFKRGNVVRGILCPSMTNSFRAPSLERSYLTYSHRQRQKSLIIVNVVDLILKIGLGLVWIITRKSTVS